MLAKGVVFKEEIMLADVFSCVGRTFVNPVPVI